MLKHYDLPQSTSASNAKQEEAVHLDPQMFDVIGLEFFKQFKPTETQLMWFAMHLEAFDGIQRWFLLTEDYIRDHFNFGQDVRQTIKRMLATKEINQTDVIIDDTTKAKDLLALVENLDESEHPQVPFILVNGSCLMSLHLQDPSQVGIEARAYCQYMTQTAIHLAVELNGLSMQCSKEQLIASYNEAEQAIKQTIANNQLTLNGMVANGRKKISALKYQLNKLTKKCLKQFLEDQIELEFKGYLELKKTFGTLLSSPDSEVKKEAELFLVYEKETFEHVALLENTKSKLCKGLNLESEPQDMPVLSIELKLVSHLDEEPIIEGPSLVFLVLDRSKCICLLGYYTNQQLLNDLCHFADTYPQIRLGWHKEVSKTVAKIIISNFEYALGSKVKECTQYGGITF